MHGNVAQDGVLAVSRAPRQHRHAKQRLRKAGFAHVVHNLQVLQKRQKSYFTGTTFSSAKLCHGADTPTGQRAKGGRELKTRIRNRKALAKTDAFTCASDRCSR